MSKLYLHYSW